MREVITDDIGQVKVGDTLLPGIFESLEIAGDVRVDEIEVTGQSGTSKQPLGFDDATLVLKIRLLTDDDSTCYDKLKTLVAVFRAVDAQAKPFVYRLVNHHAAIWGITEVIFKGLRSVEDNDSDTIRADLQFTEYRPVMVRNEEMTEMSEQPAQGFGDLRVAEREAEASYTPTLAEARHALWKDEDNVG